MPGNTNADIDMHKQPSEPQPMSGFQHFKFRMKIAHALIIWLLRMQTCSPVKCELDTPIRCFLTQCAQPRRLSVPLKTCWSSCCPTRFALHTHRLKRVKLDAFLRDHMMCANASARTAVPLDPSQQRTAAAIA